MEFDMDIAQNLMKEMVNLWVECKTRSDRIETLMKRFNETVQK